MQKSCARLFVLPVCLLVIALLGAAGPSAVSAMDADELIAKNIEASGGLQRIQGIKSAEITGKILTQGLEIPFTMYQKRPKKLRIEAAVMGMTIIQVFDGTEGWSINPMTGSSDPQPMGDIENKGFTLQADMDGPLVGYRDKGYTVEYLGEEDVEGTPAYKLRVDTKLDIVMDMFIDKEFFLPIKSHSTITVDETVVESDTYMSDFQEVEGMVLPFATETRQGGVTTMQMMLESVAYGGEMDDSRFAMPAAAAKTE